MCAERCRCPKIGCCSFLLVEWCQGMSVRWNVQSFFPVAAADIQTVLVALLEAEDWLLLAGVAPSSDGHIPFLVTYQPAAFPGIFSLNLQWKCLVLSSHIGGSTVVFPYMGAAFSRLRLILWNTRKNPRFLWLDYFLCFASYFLVVSTLPQRLYPSLTRDNIFSLWLHYALLILPVFQRAWDFLLNRSYSTLAEGGWCQFYLNLGFLKDRLYGLINLPRCHSLAIPRQNIQSLSLTLSLELAFDGQKWTTNSLICCWEQRTVGWPVNMHGWQLLSTLPSLYIIHQVDVHCQWRFA